MNFLKKKIIKKEIETVMKVIILEHVEKHRNSGISYFLKKGTITNPYIKDYNSFCSFYGIVPESTFLDQKKNGENLSLEDQFLQDRYAKILEKIYQLAIAGKAFLKDVRTCSNEESQAVLEEFGVFLDRLDLVEAKKLIKLMAKFLVNGQNMDSLLNGDSRKKKF